MEIVNKKEFFDSLKKNRVETERAALKVFKRTALNILSESIRNLQRNGNIATGKLLKNGRFKKMPSGRGYEIIYDGYASAIEFGRKAGTFPPIEDIEQWVKRKGIATGKAIKSVAFLIAKSIFRNGTKAHPFLAPAYNKYEKNIYTEIIKEINKVNK